MPKSRACLFTRSVWGGRLPEAARPAWGLTVVLVANPPGKARLASLDATLLRTDLVVALTDHVPAHLPRATGPTLVVSEGFQEWLRHRVPDPPLQLTRPFRRSLGPLRPDPGPHPDEAAAADLDTLPPHPALALADDLCADWRAIAYTDGSCVGRGEGPNSLGAAVYIPAPARSPASSPGCVLTPVGGASSSYAADGLGPTNTINRAELVAIWRALALPGITRVATDSACALSQIQHYLMHPHRMREHKHRDLLCAIHATLAARQTPVVLCKVTSHSGLVGNDMADAAARAAAEGASTHGRVDDHCDAWVGLFWPRLAHSDPARGPALAVDDLGPALKRHVMQHSALGTSDTTSYYFCQWRGVRALTCPALSNGFMRLPGFTAQQRRHTLQYRTGSLFTGSRAHLFRLRPSAACSLCHAARDDPHHIVSGCPHLSGPVTERHNAAGRLLLAAIRGGNKGAYLVAADVGTGAVDCVGVPLPRSLPPRLLGGLPAVSRPDIVLSQPAPSAAAPESCHVICVEIKYCCDWRPAGQGARIQSQHADMLAGLQAAGHTVTLVPVLLGVGGTVYVSSRDALTGSLGLTSSQADALCRLLHRHAVVSLSCIYRTKRSIENGLPHVPHDPP
ncbi:MAG: RNase H family protein [Paracoccaceae bacterium]